MTKTPGLSAGGALDDLARAVHDQRYELGPVTAYLRDPQVENIDINGFDQSWPNSPTAWPKQTEDPGPCGIGPGVFVSLG